MSDLKIVKQILLRHYSLSENPSFVFGSRANNTNRADSDLDILVMDNNISSEIVTFLNEDFENSNIPFKVDIVLRSRVDDDFFNKIKDSLKKI